VHWRGKEKTVSKLDSCETGDLSSNPANNEPQTRAKEKDLERKNNTEDEERRKWRLSKRGADRQGDGVA